MMKIDPEFVLQSNADLHRYMVRLAKDLAAANQTQMGEKVRFAAAFIIGSPTEFLRGARSALMEVREKCSDALLREEMEQVSSILERIDDAFKRIRGA